MSNSLDIGVAKLVPLPPEQWKATPTDAQQETWNLIRNLAAAVDGIVSERGLVLLSGLRSVLPLRHRIDRLVENGALEVI